MKRPFISAPKQRITSLFLVVGLSIALIGCNKPSDAEQQAPTDTNTNTSQESTRPADEKISTADESIYPDAATESDVVQEVAPDERLGTEWGDNVDSHMKLVDLRRVSSEPVEEMRVYYADKAYAGREINSMSLLNGKVDFSMTSDRVEALPMFRDSGNYYVQGQEGQAYLLNYHNNSDNIYEIVTGVDGLDVISGSAASRYNDGYVLYPHDNLTIEGFRRDEDTVASFIFSQPEGAYAANTDNGSINNTGVIGTVVYELYDPKAPRNHNDSPQAFPADNGYAPSPN